MKNLLNLLALSFSLLFIIASAPQKEDYNIFLTIDGIQYDSAIIGFVPATNRDIEIYDTALIVNGNLKYNFDANELHEGFIIPFQLFYRFENGKRIPLPSSRIRFYINAGDVIKIKANVEDQIVAYSSEGNALSKQLAEASGGMKEVYHARLKFESEFNSKIQSKWTDVENEAYWKNREENNKAYTEKNIEFISNHLNYDYSARLLLEIEDKQKVSMLYRQLDKSIQESYYGQQVGNMIAGWGIITPGLQFPDNLKLKTLQGETINLKDYKGKFILLDFWGSWCMPCLAEVPELKKLVEEHKEKLVLVGLICGDSKEKATQALEKYDMDWLQLYSDTNYFPQQFGVRVYPTKVLIDDKGIVVKEYTGSSEANFAYIREAIK